MGLRLGVQKLTPAALLIPAFAELLKAELGEKKCGKRGVGQVRRNLRSIRNEMGPAAGAEHLLAKFCRNCGGCEWATVKEVVTPPPPKAG